MLATCLSPPEREREREQKHTLVLKVVHQLADVLRIPMNWKVLKSIISTLSNGLKSTGQ